MAVSFTDAMELRRRSMPFLCEILGPNARHAHVLIAYTKKDGAGPGCKSLVVGSIGEEKPAITLEEMASMCAAARVTLDNSISELIRSLPPDEALHFMALIDRKIGSAKAGNGSSSVTSLNRL